MFVFRHGSATFGKESKKSKLGPGINDAGRKQIGMVCELFGKLELAPQIIYSSPLLRATETAELARKEFWKDSEIKVTESLLPKSDSEKVFSELSTLSGAENVVLVTHYPLIEHLVSESLDEDYSAELVNGSIMRIDFPRSPARGKGKLVWYITPFEE